MQLLVKQPGKISVVDGTPSSSPPAVLATYDASLYATDQHGKYIALATPTNVQILLAQDRSVVATIPADNITRLIFSPQASFLVTLQRVNKETNDKNLKVWHVSTGTLAYELHHRPRSADLPTLEFSCDDIYAYHMVTNTIHRYHTPSWTHNSNNSSDTQAAAAVTRLHVKGVASYGVSPTPTPHVAVFVPEVKASPAHVALYDAGAFSSGGGGEQQSAVQAPQALARKAFFRANATRFLWNSTGTAVLALAMSDVDATNQSYYGEQKLHYLATDGNDATLTLPKEGPIYDVQWTPDGHYFIVVAGFMPAKPVLYTSKCRALFEFAAGPFNTARWSPFGRFLALAGFGNLPGDVMFFNKMKDGKCKQMGSVRADNGVTIDWAPDGRSVLVATTTPRLRVDNGLRGFKYDGTQLSTTAYDVLLDVQYVPAAAGVYEDRPQSPGTQKTPGAAAAATTSTSGGGGGGGYIPPHMRGKANAAARAAGSFSLARDPHDQARAISAIAASRQPPGSAPAVTKSAAKNAKRRANKKGKDGEGAGDAEKEMTKRVGNVQL